MKPRKHIQSKFRNRQPDTGLSDTPAWVVLDHANRIGVYILFWPTRNHNVRWMAYDRVSGKPLGQFYPAAYQYSSPHFDGFKPVKDWREALRLLKAGE
jgi:hypothetical protein